MKHHLRKQLESGGNRFWSEATTNQSLDEDAGNHTHLTASTARGQLLTVRSVAKLAIVVTPFVLAPTKETQLPDVGCNRRSACPANAIMKQVPRGFNFYRKFD